MCDTAVTPSSEPKVVTEPAASEERHRREMEKLGLEIADLKRSPWSKPGTVIPLLATLVTLGVSWALGVFDVERKRIQVESDRLEMRREQLSRQVAALQDQQKTLTDDRETLKGQIADLSAKVRIAEDSLKVTQARLTETTTTLAKPILQIDSTIDEPQEVSIALHNTGRGTADVRTLRAYVSGRYVREGDRANLGMPILNALRITDSGIYWNWYLGKVKPDQTIRLWWVKPEDATPTRVASFRSLVANLGIEICYCSLLGACEWETFQRPPRNDRCS